MTEKHPCHACANPILASTAIRTGGLCMPCKGGYRENIEHGKQRATERKQYLASPQAQYWSALVNRVYHTEQGFAGLALAEQHYYAVNCLSGEVYNGGFEQYFGNSSADHYLIACAGLRTLGALHTLALLEEARGVLFGAHPVPLDQGERQLRMPTYAPAGDADCEAALDTLDARFYLDSEALDDRLRKHARVHGLFEHLEPS
ncbi:DMP19 family protein [Pseudomonas sp. MAFF212428]|uniref:DMP19 family protein n=1 Tax=Pseudomonas brassicae TaxID=2708063 RepID=A0A6B3NHA1_9PSED|nr:DMP19 family protein [Pseudomonas brassicae]NER61378.1 DMP19 family protein [Pseudomonas brassicae]NER62702.1 DMP19 family protein [Pseudomonas brassicae]